ncbi:MAG: hypothetical protein ABIK30_13395 [bacterium]
MVKSSDMLNIIAEKLRNQYENTINHNKKDPLDELMFIICSIKRREKVYIAAFRRFKKVFPSYKKILDVSQEELSEVLAPFGMQNQKALVIIEILKKITARFGKPTLAPLKRMGDKDCEEFLLGLRGVGKKVARCVMLYSLNRKVFPVDSNCWRVGARLGWINWSFHNKTITAKDMDLFQAVIPPDLRHDLHVGMVAHGRKICTFSAPQCSQCVLRDYCQNHSEILAALVESEG